MGIVSFVFALVLIYISFGKANFLYSLVFLLLGIASIVAAIKYTVGKKAYGYSGLGDVFVFVFFGLVAVLGSNFLFTKSIDWRLILPAVSIGLLSTAVLNLNNMRDIENDKIAGKNTLVVKMGLKWAKTYQEVILASGMVCFMVFVLLLNTSLTPVLIVNIPIIKHMGKVRKAEKYEDFDPELKKVALSTFALSILFWITIVFLN